MKPREFDLMRDAVDAGVLRGIRRYYKHRDDGPSEADRRQMAEAVAECVLDEISERWRFDDDEA